MRVVVGQYDLEKEDREEMTFNIEDVHLHHNWNNKKDKQDVRHDIALIKIRRKGDGTGIEVMGKSGFVRPACLPVQGNILEKDSDNICKIAGWGDTNEKDEKFNCVRQANVPILSNRKCNRLFKKSTNPKRITKGKFFCKYEVHICRIF